MSSRQAEVELQRTESERVRAQWLAEVKRDYPTRKAKLDYLFSISDPEATTRVTFGLFRTQDAIIVRWPTYEESSKFLLRDGRVVSGPYSDRKPQVPWKLSKISRRLAERRTDDQIADDIARRRMQTGA